MDSCDVLIVGGGPAGSSCAWRLRDSALDVAILDRQTFPRDKVCGGWITPSVLEELKVDPAEYGCGRILQPITSFRTGCIGGEPLETQYGSIVSYGIRRREFDDYLLKRSGARLLQSSALQGLERRGDGWIVNGNIEARLVIGAGGHFCPVARFMGAKTGGESAVVAQEAEFEMDAAQQSGCAVVPERPELYFCTDLRGYGWCFRKGNVLNVGLGRADSHSLSSHVAGFLRFLKSSGRLTFEVPPLRGHAYLLHGSSARELVRDGLMLIGDAAGLAYSMSGEGIRPAVESGLLAARTIEAAGGIYDRQHLDPYETQLAERFGRAGKNWVTAIGQRIPSQWISSLAHRLLNTRWFVRDIVLDRWFLHAGEPALSA